MRIALTIEDFRAWRGGGEGYVDNLARALLARGHEVHVFAARFDAVPDGIITHQVPIGHLLSKRVSFALRCARLLEKGRDDFDIIHGFGKSIRMDVFRPGGGVHRAWRQMEPRSVEGSGRRLWRRLRRSVSPDQRLVLRLESKQFRSDPGGPQIIANSRMVRDHILAYYRVPDERIHVIYNGVDTARFSPDNRDRFRTETRRQWGVRAADIVLLFAANNFQLKGLRPLIRAAAKLGGAHGQLRIIVMGRDRPAPYRALARRLGCAERVSFIGPLHEPEQAYAAADLSVHPTFYDPCANVTLEALASGLPVVTSTSNGAGELITPEVEGLVIDAENIEELAAAIRTFLDPHRREAAGRAARQLAEQHGMERHLKEVLAVYALARKGQS